MSKRVDRHNMCVLMRGVLRHETRQFASPTFYYGSSRRLPLVIPMAKLSQHGGGLAMQSYKQGYHAAIDLLRVSRVASACSLVIPSMVWDTRPSQAVSSRRRAGGPCGCSGLPPPGPTADDEEEAAVRALSCVESWSREDMHREACGKGRGREG